MSKKPKRKEGGLSRRLASFRFAWAGVRELFTSQPNARIHLLIALLVVLAGWFFEVSKVEWCLLVLCMVVVLTAEGVNTALEHLTNLVSPDYHPLAGKAKDSAAGAVLLAAIGAAVVGLIIFLPKIFAFLQTLG